MTKKKANLAKILGWGLLVRVDSPMWRRQQRAQATGRWPLRLECDAKLETENRSLGREQGQFTGGLEGSRRPPAKDKALAGTVTGQTGDIPAPVGHTLRRKRPFSSNCLFVSEPGDMVVNSDQTSRFQNHSLIYL